MPLHVRCRLHPPTLPGIVRDGSHHDREGATLRDGHGEVTYDPTLVIASVIIAIVAATAALTLTLIVRGPVLATAAALVMGLAVSTMRYTGMYAVSINFAPSGTPLSGATATEFIFPLAVVLGSFLFLTSAYVALSPTGKRHESAVAAELLREVELSTA